MTELYSSLARREKGALGLLFEMNLFLGFGLLGYILYWLHHNPTLAKFKGINGEDVDPSSLREWVSY